MGLLPCTCVGPTAHSCPAPLCDEAAPTAPHSHAEPVDRERVQSKDNSSAEQALHCVDQITGRRAVSDADVSNRNWPIVRVALIKHLLKNLADP